jgi:hypothetical protein
MAMSTITFYDVKVSTYNIMLQFNVKIQVYSICSFTTLTIKRLKPIIGN